MDFTLDKVIRGRGSVAGANKCHNTNFWCMDFV
jgi:hypothetical protein